MSNATVGFGTAALGDACFDTVLTALQEGFRMFDTAEADWWYNQKEVGRALEEYFTTAPDDECVMVEGTRACGMMQTCAEEDLRISTKIGPWDLVSEEKIRANAAASRKELVGFCEDEQWTVGGQEVSRPFPLDVYLIHAPTCWDGWHPRCKDHPPLLELRQAWLAMEAVVGLDHSSRRIGLSNVHPPQLLDIIQFVQGRQQATSDDPAKAPPRMPDVVQNYADPINPAEDVRKICQEHGIEFVSYSTLGTQHRGGSGNPVLGSPAIRQIASRHGRSAAEVVLSWALHSNMSVIPRSRQRKHIQELARLLRDDPDFLDAEDLTRIDAMKKTA
jgi:diketogulonate reductase-like aldo/keto reductase